MKVYIGRIDYNSIQKNENEYLAKLSKYRLDKAKCISVEKSRLASIFTGVMLEDILNNEYGINLDNTTVSLGENGKPILDNYDIKYNISHCKEYVVIAFAEYEIGIDIEMIEKDGFKIAERFFCEEEYNYITSSENPKKEFCRIWTMKESFVKLTGEGMKKSFNSFSTSISERTNVEYIYIDEMIAKEHSLYKKLKDIDNYRITMCRNLKMLDKVQILLYNNVCC